MKKMCIRDRLMTQWLAKARTLLAPASFMMSAALVMVPAVSTMSSTMMLVRLKAEVSMPICSAMGHPRRLRDVYKRQTLHLTPYILTFSYFEAGQKWGKDFKEIVYIILILYILFL